VGVVLVLAVMPFTWELSCSVRVKKEKRRGNEMWKESSIGCGRGGAGWWGWREEGGAGRLVPFSGFNSPISGHLLRMKGETEMSFVRNPVGPITRRGPGVSSKTSHSFT